MVSDGWMDGMTALQVAACAQVLPGFKLRIFQWSDANDGSWFEKGAGLSLVERSPLAPARF